MPKRTIKVNDWLPAFGTSVETLAQSGDFNQVRLSDGTTGWVKTAFLTPTEAAVVSSQALEEGSIASAPPPPPCRSGGAQRSGAAQNRNLLHGKASWMRHAAAEHRRRRLRRRRRSARRHPGSGRDAVAADRRIALVIRVGMRFLAGYARWRGASRTNSAASSLLNADS